jgi:Rad3-related DNA helicase
MIEIDDKKIYYPIKYKPRDYQITALDFLKKSILSGKKFACLNLPTGVGKSYIAVAMFTNWYKNFINTDSKFDILTNSKVLQEQYLRDFDFIKNFKGRSNYYCQHYDTDCANGGELNRIMKRSCTNCPYDYAKNQWLMGDVSLTNFHLFNTLSIYQKDMLRSREANVLIIDESHDFESVFSDFLSTKLNATILKRCGFTLKEVETYDNKFISKTKTLQKYLKFLESKLIPDMESKLKVFELRVQTTHDVSKKRQLTQYIQNLEGKILSFNGLFETYKKDANNIVLDIITNKKDKMYSGIDLVTQPIWVYDYIKEFIWQHYDHVIFMSASILDKEMFMYINGLEENLTSYYEMSTPFPVKNRKIYYLKVGKMNFFNKEETFKKQLKWIKHILKKYEGKKGIIHTTNYEITEWLKENINDKRLLFHDTKDRQEILEKHLYSKEPTILVSPSMMSGVDLKDDLARFQILLKIPYPNITSQKIKSRQKTNKKFYAWKTVVDLIQSYGRAVRSEDDYADFYILDSNFSDVLKYSSHYIPQYMQDAIKILNI